MFYRSLLILSLSVFVALPLRAAEAPTLDKPEFELTIKDHVFVPAQLTVPANKTIKLTIKNTDATSAEFESDDFQAEKIVPANGEITLFVGPFKAGNYGFYDDFHEDDTKGTLIVQ